MKNYIIGAGKWLLYGILGLMIFSFILKGCRRGYHAIFWDQELNVVSVKKDYDKNSAVSIHCCDHFEYETADKLVMKVVFYTPNNQESQEMEKNIGPDAGHVSFPDSVIIRKIYFKSRNEKNKGKVEVIKRRLKKCHC